MVAWHVDGIGERRNEQRRCCHADERNASDSVDLRQTLQPRGCEQDYQEPETQVSDAVLIEELFLGCAPQGKRLAFGEGRPAYSSIEISQEWPLTGAFRQRPIEGEISVVRVSEKEPCQARMRRPDGEVGEELRLAQTVAGGKGVRSRPLLV